MLFFIKVSFIYEKITTFARKFGLYMEKNDTDWLGNFSGYLFWDADPKELSMEDNAPYIIQRVLEYGQMDDWRLINRYYGLDRIVSECKQLRTLDPVCLSFICNISHTNEEEYRCYRYRQYNPTLWNS
jgi:hypothetical protein